VEENQVILDENLKVKGMLRNHQLAKFIADCGWGIFVNLVSYQAKEDGKTFLEIDSSSHFLKVVIIVSMLLIAFLLMFVAGVVTVARHHTIGRSTPL
jgi:hypothetical protein